MILLVYCYYDRAKSQTIDSRIGHWPILRHTFAVLGEFANYIMKVSFMFWIRRKKRHLTEDVNDARNALADSRICCMWILYGRTAGAIGEFASFRFFSCVAGHRTCGIDNESSRDNRETYKTLCNSNLMIHIMHT